jgi:hypothetical protein
MHCKGCETWGIHFVFCYCLCFFLSNFLSIYQWCVSTTGESASAALVSSAWILPSFSA